MVATIGSAKKLSVKSSVNKKSTKQPCIKHKSSAKSKKQVSAKDKSNKVQKLLIHPQTQNKITISAPDQNNNTEYKPEKLVEFTLKLPKQRVPKK